MSFQAPSDGKSNFRPGDNAPWRPVFVASNFRTSSTWLWLKLRASPNTIAYCEVFHEILATLTFGEAANLSASSWQSKHPVSAPYFVEFLPLLKEGGGVEGYLPDMAFQRFIPPEGVAGDLSAAEAAYVALLIEHARKCRKIPVLTCTRALGRSKALKRAFDFYMIFLHRNIFHQWASYSQQAMSGNNYFIDTIERTLTAAAHDPFLNSVSEWFYNRVNSHESIDLFYAFLLMNIYLAAVGHDAADLTINVTQIASDPQLNRDGADQLSQMVCSKVELDDAKLDFGCISLPTVSRSVSIDLVQQFTKMIGEAELSERAHKFAERAAEQALGEWERHEFFSRGQRSIQAKAIADLTDRSTAAQQEADMLRVENEVRADAQQAMAAERDNALAKIETLNAEHEALTLKLNNIRHDATIAAEKASAEAEKRVALVTERDHLLAQVSALNNEIDELRAQLEMLAATRQQTSENRNAGS